MRNAARILMDERDWWHRVDDERHGALTEAAHELSDEAARTLQYLALLCGALARDAGWDEVGIQTLAASVRERVAYDLGIITDHAASLMLAGYHGIADTAR